MSNSNNKNIYYVLGIMSGTSLDGLDLAYSKFTFTDKIEFEILDAKVVDYSVEWKKTLTSIENSTALNLTLADRELGKWIGRQVKKFINDHNLKDIDFIASHGHTIFHQPERAITLQIGHGAYIAAESNLPVVCDFRSLDVALQGQGAPLVPIGDQLLFSDVDYCLNLGGIANISFKNSEGTIAFDVCPANMVLNYLANQLNLEYDKDGILASNGVVILPLLNQLNSFGFYVKSPPKSLGKEWVYDEIIPLLENLNNSVEDKLATFCAHIAFQIAAVINKTSKQDKVKMMITGGGAFNIYLIDFLKKELKNYCEIIIPDEKTVKFKEALIFALLGILRWRQEINCLKTVTGAAKDNIGGCIYLN